jgi:hypothetical protein
MEGIIKHYQERLLLHKQPGYLLAEFYCEIFGLMCLSAMALS